MTATGPDSVGASRDAWLWIALGGAAFFLLPTLGYGFGFDHGFMQYIAAAALRGQWPYVDSWDTAFPGAILLHMAVQAVGGRSALAIRVADFAIGLATAGLLFTLVRRVAGAAAGVYAACAYAIAYTGGTYYHTAQRDGYLVPLLLGGLLGIWRFLDGHPGRRRTLAWAGLSSGLACLMRPTYALAVALTTVLLGARHLWGKQVSQDHVVPPLRAALLDAAVFGGAGAAPLVMFVVWYAATGRFHAIVELLALLSTVYPHLERLPRAEVLERFYLVIAKSLWIGAILSVGSSAWRTHRKELITTALLFAMCVVIRLWESKGYRYQYWPALATLCVVAAVGWQWLGTGVVRRLGLTGRAAVLCPPAVFALVLVAQFGRQGVDRYRGLGSAIAANADPANLEHMIADSRDQAELAGYLRSHMGPQDRVQLWGPETIVLYASGRLSATRFLDPFTFLCPGSSGLTLFTDCGPAWNKPIQVAFLREFIGQLDAQPPDFIAAHEANGSLAIKERYCIAPDLPALRDLLDRRYRREATFGNWAVFKRLGDRFTRSPSRPRESEDAPQHG